MKGSPKNTVVSTGSGVGSGSSPFLLDEQASTLKMTASMIKQIVLIYKYSIRYPFQNDLPTRRTPLSKSSPYSHGARMLAGCTCPSRNGTYNPMPDTTEIGRAHV